MRVGWCLFVLRGSIAESEVSPEEEESSQEGENRKRDYLHDDTGDCNIASNAQLVIVSVSTSGQPSASSLQTERHAITADEEPGVVFRLEIAVLRSECFDKMLQSQINSHGQPSRAHNQTAYLHCEAIVGKRVMVQHEAADVADCFHETAAGESEGESPCSVSDAEVELGDEEDDEESEEEDVGGEGREVTVN